MCRHRSCSARVALLLVGAVGASAGAPQRAVAQPEKTVVSDSIRKFIIDSTRKAYVDSTKKADRSCAGARPLFRGEFPTKDFPPVCVPELEIFADGNVKDVLGGKEAANAAGALGLHYTGEQFEVTGLVNIAGTRDTVRAGYGPSILLPAAGQALNAGALIIRLNRRRWNDTSCLHQQNRFGCNWGLRIHADASTRLWATRLQRVAAPTAQGTSGSQTRADSVDRVVETMQVPIFGFGLNASYTFFRDALREDNGSAFPVQMVLDVGYLHRAIRGDITSPQRDTLRNRLLGDEAKDFGGLEIGLTMIYHQIRTSLTYARVRGKVDGLTRGQILALVDLRAPIRTKLLRSE